MKITKRVLKFDMVLDGVKIHSLDELREHPSTELLELQKDGRLSRWLRAHGCTNEADKLCEMPLSGNRARDLYAICQVLAIDVELEDILDALKEESSKDSVPSGDSVEDNSLRSDQAGPQQTRCESQQQNSQHAGESLWPFFGGSRGSGSSFEELIDTWQSINKQSQSR